MCLIVDFDGTLSEIVDDPARSVPVAGVTTSLQRLAARLGGVVVISGRPGTFLADRLDLSGPDNGVRAFGLYGQEEVAPGGTVVRREEPTEHLEAFAAVARATHHLAPSARVEEKGGSVALHFRESPEVESVLEEIAQYAAIRHGLVIRRGRMVLELVAPGSPDKGTVTRSVIGSANVVVAFGDDLGDLAVFDTLDDLADDGTARAIKVAVGGADAPQEVRARADFVLTSPRAVAEVLQRLAEDLGESR